MISDPKNLTEQLQNLSERIAIEMRALNRTKVSKINGAIPDNNGEVTIDTGVTSFNGSKGAVTYTAPVTSVNGKTGAVNIDVGVKTVNGTAPDSSGNVTIEVSGGGGGGSGDAIPKTGDRGLLAGYNNCLSTLVVSDTAITIDENSPDDMHLFVSGGATLTLEFASGSTSAYVKNIFLMVDSGSVVTTFNQGAFADTFFQSYVNDLGLSMANQIVVTSYFSETTGNWVIVSNKVLM